MTTKTQTVINRLIGVLSNESLRTLKLNKATGVLIAEWHGFKTSVYVSFCSNQVQLDYHAEDFNGSLSKALERAFKGMLINSNEQTANRLYIHAELKEG